MLFNRFFMLGADERERTCCYLTSCLPDFGCLYFPWPPLTSILFLHVLHPSWRAHQTHMTEHRKGRGGNQTHNFLVARRQCYLVTKNFTASSCITSDCLATLSKALLTHMRQADALACASRTSTSWSVQGCVWHHMHVTQTSTFTQPARFFFGAIFVARNCLALSFSTSSQVGRLMQGGRDAGAGGLVSGSEGQTPGGGISYHSHQKCLSAAIH